MSKGYDVIVIGCGITGLNAARRSLQNGMTTATLESGIPGGLVLNINHLDGAIAGSGMDLSSELMSEVHDRGADSIGATATAIRQEGNDLIVESDAGAHRAASVIVASGARFRRLGVPGEAELEGQGVSHCADCDGPLHQDRDVVVVGGGDSALQEALILSQFARQVHLVHRGTEFRARGDLVDQISGQTNIAIYWRTEVEAVLGAQALEAVRVRTKDGDQRREIACTGFFAYVGLEPVSEFVPEAVSRDSSGFLITDPSLRTTMPRLLAAGAVRSGYGGLLSHAVAEGVAAADSTQSQGRGHD